MSTVCLEQVRKVYRDGHVAVAGASFEVANGELLVLVGPSGCGKTTLLRMIAGLESPTAGTVRIDGRVVNDEVPKARDVAMVFQNYALYPHMTVAQNLGFGLKLRGHGRAEVDRRVREVAATLGLESRLDARPATLSGGQRQRVALGRALVRDPKVFLLDEPLSNLDARLRLAMRLELARLHRRLGATMVHVTHDQVEAMTLGQRIVVLDRGVIQQIDTPMAVYQRPANLFVAGFLGSPAMNLLPGRLQCEPLPALLTGDGPIDLTGAPQLGPLRHWHGRELVLGLRPEDLQPAADPSRGRLRAQLELPEPVGAETFLNLRRGGRSLVARVPSRPLPPSGSTMALNFAPSRLHFFDPVDGGRIDPGGLPPAAARP